MSKFWEKITESDPLSLIVAGFLLALFFSVLGHMLYLAGIVAAIATVVVGAAYFIGARHGNKPGNGEDGNPGDRSDT